MTKPKFFFTDIPQRNIRKNVELSNSLPVVPSFSDLSRPNYDLWMPRSLVLEGQKVPFHASDELLLWNVVEHLFFPKKRLKNYIMKAKIFWSILALILNVLSIIYTLLITTAEQPEASEFLKKSSMIGKFLAENLNFGNVSFWEVKVLWITSMFELVAVVVTAVVHTYHSWNSNDSLYLPRAIINLSGLSAFKLLPLWHNEVLTRHIEAVIEQIHGGSSYSSVLLMQLLAAVMALIAPLYLVIKVKRIFWILDQSKWWREPLLILSLFAFLISISQLHHHQRSDIEDVLLVLFAKRNPKRKYLEFKEMKIETLKHLLHYELDDIIVKVLGKRNARLFVLAKLDDAEKFVNAIKEIKSYIY